MKRLAILVLLVVPVALYSSSGVFRETASGSQEVAAIERGPLSVWSTYNGTLDSRTAVTIMSKVKGSATVVDLVPAGSKVSKGEVLVRLDSAELERRLLKLEKEYALAKIELETILNAKLPLERRDLEMELFEVRTRLKVENNILEDILEFAKEDLVSKLEVEKQKTRVAELKAKRETLEMKVQLTKEFLHPAAIRRAKTELSSAEQALKLAKQEVLVSVIKAPRDGVVVYRHLQIGGQFRTIRVGDSVYPNQPFMILPDMSDLLVNCQVPETELSRIGKGNKVIVRPLAYPGLALDGVIERISAVAQNAPGRPIWQRFFHVVISLEETDSRLRPGLSVTAHVQSYDKPNAILVPRNAVSWVSGNAIVQMAHGSAAEPRQITVGLANNTHYEVIDGLTPGETVLLE